jgi:Fur family ferric uptake transcriptional regulator
VYERWAQEAYQRLARSGFRSGGARQDVIEMLARDGGCVTAPELVTRLRDEGRRASVASVYRALSTLRDLRLLRAFDHGEGMLRYELDDPDTHHHHMICETCGTNEVFEDTRLEQAIHAAADDRDYRVAAHDVVLFGLCADCRRSAG